MTFICTQYSITETNLGLYEKYNRHLRILLLIVALETND